ncbi:MAG: response regulator, partial [Bdellovibrionaceae bacterium]|nr:response regulator [Pseudobdellovibrionaceae bacterium]MDW8189583.1 response regulator [Pseudobdellovibrionaceae bacterium]
MNLNRLRVLVVDDEEELLASMDSILRDLLKDYDLTVSKARTGREALGILEHEEFDLIIMDVKMPEMDGLSALREIRKMRPESFIVIQTAHANLKEAVEAIRMGAYDYIEKPIQVDKLRALIHKCLETRQLVHEVTFSHPLMDDDIESEMVGSSNKMKEI